MRRAAGVMMALTCFALAACSESGHHHDYPAPEQPDPAIAESIDAALAAMPGVLAVEVDHSHECIDGCKAWRPQYVAIVRLATSVTAAELVAITTTHHNEFVAAGIDPEVEAFTASYAASGAVEITVPSTTLTDPLASGFLLLAQADVEAPARLRLGESVAMSMQALHAESCDGIDEVVAPMYAALSEASAIAGLPYAALTASCGRWASMTIPVLPGSTFVAGWAEMLEPINELSLEVNRPDGTIQDFYVDLDGDGTVVIHIEVNSGFKLTDEHMAVLNKLVDDLKKLGAPNATLDITQF